MTLLSFFQFILPINAVFLDLNNVLEYGLTNMFDNVTSSLGIYVLCFPVVVGLLGNKLNIFCT